MADILSIAGLLLILAGWAFELMNAVSQGRASVPLKFSILYASGSLLLAYHSFNIGDGIFLALNSAAFLVASANILLWLAQRQKPKTR
ncbi:MAG: hypothetical protein N3F07_03340 [Candidatus Micrarchaeota archaeon]|nr:hypothetical protein [Candidatus Micrarchaeota archaeon]